MSTDKKLRDKLMKLHWLLGSSNQNERETARAKILELLAKNKKTWNDLTEVMAGKEDGRGWQDVDEADTVGDDDPQTLHPAPLDLIHRLTERYLHLSRAQRVALNLWIAHTHVYIRFSITPRLALVSPVRGCGKTTALNLADALSRNASKVDHITPAVLFRLIDRDRACVLLDEVDNQDLPANPTLRAVINSGHHCGGKIMRYIDGGLRTFTTFAPMALAVIGKLPFPVLHRSIVLHMERAPDVNLERFDPRTIPEQERMCRAVYNKMFAWAQRCRLNLDPPMPKELRNRPADNWRVLFAIADACSPEWGKAARDAAIELSKGQDEDPGVQLLFDVCDIFNSRPTLDRIGSAILVQELIDLPDGRWSEWRGVHDDSTPRKIT
jgi:Protein of unknown function (DUF3631)